MTPSYNLLTGTKQAGEVKLGPTPFDSNMGQAAAAVALYASGMCAYSM